MNWFCYQRGVWVIALIGIKYSQLLILGLHIVKVMGEYDCATQFWSLHWLTEKCIQHSSTPANQEWPKQKKISCCSVWTSGARHENLQSYGMKNMTQDFFFFCSYRSIIILQRGIHHSHKGRDNISTFKDGRKFIMRWDKKCVMLMSFWFSVFVRVSVLLYGSWFRAKCKSTHVEGEVALKSFEGQV